MYNRELIDIRQQISRKQILLDNIQAISNVPKQLKVDVLMIDDDLIACTVYKKYMEDCDQISRIVVKNNIASSFAYLEELHNKNRPFPKLILLDLHVPGEKCTDDFLAEFSDRYSKKGSKILIFTSIPPVTHDLFDHKKVIGLMTKPLKVSELEALITKEILDN